MTGVLQVADAGSRVREAYCVFAARRRESVVAKHDLGRSVGAIGLLLIHMGGGGIDEGMNIISGALDAVRAGHARGAGHDHEVVGTRGRVKERIIFGDRHVDNTIPTLVDKVEAVIEELGEESHEGVEGRRESFVDRRVGNEELVLTSNVGTDIRTVLADCSVDRSGVACGLINNQMTDQAGPRVLDRHGYVVVSHGADSDIHVLCCHLLGADESPIHLYGEGKIGRAEAFLSRNRIIELAVNRAQTPRNGVIGQDVGKRFSSHMPLGDLDLLQNEVQILGIECQIARGRSASRLCEGRLGHRPERQRESYCPSYDKRSHRGNTREHAASGHSSIPQS